MNTISNILKNEELRQSTVINLIPSENVVSDNVLKALGSVFTNKYAEGYAHHRYYAGNQCVDELKDTVIDLVYKAFNVNKEEYGVNVQTYSGSSANFATYFGVLDIGDKVLSMSLSHGGHLTHGHTASVTNKLFTFKHYGVNIDGVLDYDNIRALAKEFRPKLIIAGTSAYPRTLDFKMFKEIADEVGALLMTDIAHIAGLVVGGVHPSPLPYADIVTMTTHKTLRGPRGAIIISKKLLSENINKAVFPGLQGGPHMNAIAAIGVALEEATTPQFKEYAIQVVKNAKMLAKELKNAGFTLIANGTDNHLMLIDVSKIGLTGQQASEMLEKVGIIVNKNAIPYDLRKPWDPSGIRIGTPVVTSQGMLETEMITIAKRIAKTLLKSF